jgi:hypothetical protein
VVALRMFTAVRFVAAVKFCPSTARICVRVHGVGLDRTLHLTPRAARARDAIQIPNVHTLTLSPLTTPPWRATGPPSAILATQIPGFSLQVPKKRGRVSGNRCCSTLS